MILLFYLNDSIKNILFFWFFIPENPFNVLNISLQSTNPSLFYQTDQNIIQKGAGLIPN